MIHGQQNVKNTLVTFDRFFTKVKLMSRLLKKGVYTCGTVRSSRKGLPKMKKEKSKLPRGEFQFERKGAISAVKWMDNRPVAFLSSFQDPRKRTMVKKKETRMVQAQRFSVLKLWKNTTRY
jgi:hypothetical protein